MKDLATELLPAAEKGRSESPVSFRQPRALLFGMTSRDKRSSAKFEAMLFAVCKDDDNKASMKTFFEEINRTGIRAKTDPRLAPLISNLEKYRAKPGAPLDSISLEFDQFRHVLSGNLPLITKIFRNDLVIPEFESFCQNVTTLYNKLKENFDGAPATYIPQLARVPASKWGISICTVDGQRFAIGDVHDKFTIQSTSKPITYALTLEELGTEVVHKYQGREPSGRMFNEIVLDHNNQPHNPMVNSGAIMSSSILLYLVKPEMNVAQKYDYVFDFFKKMAGGEYLGFNNSIFLSERDSADRNSALGYFMRENMCYPPGDINIPNTLDFYFQLCSLEMTSESECVIASTLANGGVCPITGKRILSPESVKNVLSLMLSCGLYNYSGDFAFKVGLPAKSGVSGALMMVVPNVMGITFWSPPLDDMGNTVRGVQFCEEFVRLYNFHKVTGELSDGSSRLIDPTKNKYEVASQLIIHLLMAASAGDETALKCAFQQGVDMNLGDYDGRTALHLAAAEGHIRCVKFLLEDCKVKHDCKDRWGQTPLTEAILFKHTKVASLIKRHERALTMQTNKTKNKIGGALVQGEVLWRKLVERNLMKPEKEKPIYKFDKSHLAGGDEKYKEEQRLRDEKALEAIKTTLKDQFGSGGIVLKKSRKTSLPPPAEKSLKTLMEEHKKSMELEMGLDGSKEEEEAAKLIQNKFRTNLLQKRSSKTNLLPGETAAVKEGNGTKVEAAKAAGSQIVNGNGVDKTANPVSTAATTTTTTTTTGATTTTTITTKPLFSSMMVNSPSDGAAKYKKTGNPSVQILSSAIGNLTKPDSGIAHNNSNGNNKETPDMIPKT